MTETPHERASKLIAKAIDMQAETGRSYIIRNSKGNKDLEELALELYEGVLNEDSRSKNHSHPVVTKANSPTGIDASDNKYREAGKINNHLFGEKVNRLVTLGISIILISAFAFIVRYQFQKLVITTEGAEQQTMLDLNYKALQFWIKNRTIQTHKMARNPEIIELSAYLDSLVEKVPSYALLKLPENMDWAYKTITKVRNENHLEALGIINRRDPVYMLLSEISHDGKDHTFEGLRLGKRGYEHYLLLGDSVLFIPPLHDTEKFQTIPDSLNVGTYCTFACPIYKDSVLVGYLFNEYNVKNEFSTLLNVTHHKKTAETYAVNNRGQMVSESRFIKELQNSYLLNYDTTKSAIFNIKLLDPGVNVFKRTEAKTPVIDQRYTRIVADIYQKLQQETPEYQGTIMKPYRGYRGIPVVGAWRWFPEYNFGLIDEIDSKESLRSLKFFDVILLLFFLALIALTLLLYNSNVRIAKFGKKIDDFKRLGRYRLLEKLGEGGFGEVYKAEHTYLKTPVAIKLLKNEFTGTDMLQRFEKEVKVTASLSNPNTVRVYDYGTSDSGQFYYVMEFLDGVSLDKVVNPYSSFSVNRCIYILINCCFSLNEAHSKGLVHRDIKPMNIMLCNQGGAYDVVKVLDFGLVKNLDTSISQQTEINRIGGTPMFMAPERLRDPYNADHRVDIYALGALGLYMLSGQYLVELISQKMLSGQETLLGNFNQNLIERADVPLELKNLLERCVSFNPDKRPENIEQLIIELENLKSRYPWTREDARNWWQNYDVYG